MSRAVMKTRLWRQYVRQGLTLALPRRLLLARGPAVSRAVCLTFDDGPHPEHTPPLLDRLKELGVVATFFVIGAQAARYPELVRRMADEGHAIGHHSYFHAEPRSVSARQLMVEVQQSMDLLAPLVSEPPTLFRPPKGQLTVAKLWRLWHAGQTIVLWSADPKDYLCASGEEVRRWFRDQPMQAGDIVLLHDRLPHATAAVSELVENARQRGLSFTTPYSWISPT